MSKQLYVVVTILLIILATVGVANLRKQHDNLELQQIQLHNRTNELKIEKLKTEKLQDTLNDSSVKTNEQIKDYERQLKESQEREKQLQAELQAKREKKANEAKVAHVPTVAGATVAQGGTCSDWLAQAGIHETYAVQELIRRESGCNPNAVNPSSGACGIPQSLPCNKLPNGLNTSPTDQLIWMQNYVMNRYGSWESALAFHDRNSWY